MRSFIITYIDSKGRMVHRAAHDGRWYWMDLDTWRLLPRKPRLVRHYC